MSTQEKHELTDGEVHFVPPEGEQQSPLRDTHEELYGCLLSVNEDVSDAGAMTMMVMILAAAVFSVALHLRWVDFEPLRSIWFYIVAVIAAFIGGGMIAEMQEAVAYRRRRRELTEAIARSGLNAYTILARISGDKQVSDVATRLMKDHRAMMS